MVWKRKGKGESEEGVGDILGIEKFGAWVPTELGGCGLRDFPQPAWAWSVLCLVDGEDPWIAGESLK